MVSQEIGTSGHSSIGPSGHSQSVKSTGSRVGLGNRNSQRESIFGRARASFVRSGGDRGATLATLRGTRGADFEAKGEVQRVHPDALGGCFCFGKNSGTDSDVVILIKGPFCFIFKNEEANSPKYAISLAQLKAKKQSGSKSAVALETNLGDVEYEIFLKDSATADLFETTVTQQASAGQAEMVRKRLGHEHLLSKRASVRYAESVATKKIEDQPEAPVSTEEILANVPMPSVM